MTTRSRRSASERGAGVLSTLAGFTTILVLLLFAVDVAVSLRARALVTSIAYDAASDVASADGQDDIAHAVADAEAAARDLLGTAGTRAMFEWAIEREHLRLRVVVPHGGRLLPTLLRERAGLHTVDRTVRVRREVWVE